MRHTQFANEAGCSFHLNAKYSAHFYVRMPVSAIGANTAEAFNAYLNSHEAYIIYQMDAPVEKSLTDEELAAYDAMEPCYPLMLVDVTANVNQPVMDIKVRTPASPSPEWPRQIQTMRNVSLKTVGRQILRGTKTFEFMDASSISGTVDHDNLFHGCSTLITNRAWYGYKVNLKAVAEREGLRVGDVLTYSIWVCSQQDIPNAQFTRYYTSPSGSNALRLYTGKLVSGEWKQLSVTFVLDDSTMNTNSFRIEYDSPNTGSPDYAPPSPIFYSQPMLERGDTAHEWVDYIDSQVYTAPNGLPGIRVAADGNYTDANGQQWICDEIDLARGVYIQRVHQFTYNGSEPWNTWGVHGTDGDRPATGFYCYGRDTIGGKYKPLNAEDGIVTSFRYAGGAWNGGMANVGSFASVYGDAWYFQCAFTDGVMGKQESKDSALAWLKQYLHENPMTVLYPLADPIETPIEQFRTVYPSLTITSSTERTEAAVKVVDDGR